MTDGSYKVTFQPEGRTVYELPGSSLFEAAGRAGIILNSPCGGKGLCGKCLVQITRNAPEPTERDADLISEEDLAEGWRLACQTHIRDDMVVNVPGEARLFAQKILVEGAVHKVSLKPAVKKHFVTIPPPCVEDLRSDLERVLDALTTEDRPKPDVWVASVRDMPAILRQSDFRVTAVLDEDELLCIEAGDTTDRTWGVAFDVGTTTVVGLLLDLSTGAELAAASRTNPQVVYGDDVISRIQHASTQDGGKELQSKIAEALDDIIGELCEKTDATREGIYDVTVAGNTTMSHLLLALDPTYVAQAPYVSVVRSTVQTKARELGLHVNPQANLYVLPNIAGFVGGDTVAGVLATRLHETKDARMLIDIGTNGEIVLASDGRLVACSCAAGPAFEGARIGSGMRAMEGAIEKVLMQEDVQVNVIGGVPPRGICGTGLIDAVAELVRLGIVDETGRLLEAKEAPSDLPDALRKRIVEGKSGNDFVLAPEGRTGTGEALLLTQKDIREVQLAKSAIFTGIQICKATLGLEDEDIAEVLLAGAFGNFIRRNMAQRIGLLPAVSHERIRFVGNAAGAGAKMALACRTCRHEAEEISRNTEYVELAAHPEFQDVFMDSMMFPSGRTC